MNMKSKIVLEMELVEHGKVVLTSPTTDTYTSKSEELIDFLHGARMYSQSGQPPESTPPEGKGYSEAQMVECFISGNNHPVPEDEAEQRIWAHNFIASLPSPPVKDDSNA